MKLISALLVSLLLTGCGHSAKVRPETKEARDRILEQIIVGSSLAETEVKLKNAGFACSKPIDQTGRGEYLVQLVSIHSEYVRPTFMETFRYTLGLPFPKSTMPHYVSIYADMTGKITGVQ